MTEETTTGGYINKEWQYQEAWNKTSCWRKLLNWLKRKILPLKNRYREYKKI